MFSFQPSDDLVFGTPTTPQGYQIREDPIVDHAFMENNFINFSTESNDTRLSRTADFGLSRQRQRESRYECNIRRVLHRDIERKRRLEMSNLYVSLRSLLPLEHIKGKRSVCDQMHEAANYIKYMKKNIQELGNRRDKLKKLSNFSRNKVKISSNGSDDHLPNCVTLNLVTDGMEILISSCIKSTPDLRLSRVFGELEERELDVVSSVSTRTKGGFLHKIQIEARDMTSLDVCVLQDKLTNVMK